MTDISTMSDERKSVLLARAIKAEMGISGYLPVESPEFINSSRLVNLYHPANMALAKRVIEWGAENVPKFRHNTLNLIAYAAWTKPDGVRTLLDELAIEAGIVEV